MGTFAFLSLSFIFLSFGALFIVIGDYRLSLIDIRRMPLSLFFPFLSELMTFKHILKFLLRYGTPHIWRASFLSSSRGLHKTSGRILPIPLHNEPEDGGQDFNTAITNANEFSSPGGGLKRARRTTTTTTATTGRLRMRHSSLSSSDASDVSDASNASNASGRVRGMVDSLEKSASASAAMMMTGSAPSSPTKGASSRYLLGLELDEEDTASASASASSESIGVAANRMSGNRGLPHHRSVSDLFGGAADDGDAALAVQEKEARDGGGTGVVRRNGNAPEPRLLPFPPGTFFLLFFLSFRVYGMFIAILFSTSSAPHNFSNSQHHPQGHGLGLLTPVHTCSCLLYYAILLDPPPDS